MTTSRQPEEADNSFHYYYEDNNEGSLFQGLGYHTSSNAATGVASSRNDDDPSTNDGTNGNATASSIVQSMMQQCLAYHEEQEALRARRTGEGQQTQPQPQQQYQPQQQQIVEVDGSNASLLLPGTTTSSITPLHDEAGAGVVEETRSIRQEVALPISSYTSLPEQERQQHHPEDDDEATEQQIEQARARAQAILARFQQQQQNLLFCNHDDNNHPTINEGLVTAAVSPSLFSEQRRIGLEREELRKQRALLKNLEYVAEREQSRIQQLQMQEQQTAKLAQLSQLQYERQFEERKHRILSGFQKKKTTSSQPAHEQRKRHKTKTVALYLSGLPVDGSVDEQYLRHLFGGYGTIVKIHFYRHKETDVLKGDGLIVYQVTSDIVSSTTADETYSAAILVQTVTEQMNGAELPCGSILRVEPANSSKSDQNRQIDRLVAEESRYRPTWTDPGNASLGEIHHPQGEETIACPAEKSTADAPSAKPPDHTDDNLDEFFDSL